MIVPVILAGGSGTRLWPVSTQQYPKQFIALNGEHTLFQQTLLRVNTAQFAAPVIVCADEHRFIVAQQLMEVSIKAQAIILEPSAKNTAPGLALAAHWLLQHSGSTTMLVCPADHAISKFESMAQSLSNLAPLAQNQLITFGIKPTSAHTGYGYIQLGEHIEEFAPCQRVASFVEKPNAATAQRYVQQGLLWNSGMLLCSVHSYLSALQRHEPALAQGVAHCAHFTSDLDFIRIDSNAWQQVKARSIDYAVLEHDQNVVCAPTAIEWSDLGSFGQVYAQGEKDTADNVISANTAIEQSHGNYVYSDQPHLLALLGVDDLAIVHSGQATLVAKKSHLQEMPALLAQIQTKSPEHLQAVGKVYRPWGSYEVINQGVNFKVKRIELKPHQRLSLQSHQHRSEHWVVVKGCVTVQVEEKEFALKAGESTFIAQKQRHRLSNFSDTKAQVIEVQIGNYLGEDDITRFEDDFGR